MKTQTKKNCILYFFYTFVMLLRQRTYMWFFKILAVNLSNVTTTNSILQKLSPVRICSYNISSSVVDVYLGYRLPKSAFRYCVTTLFFIPKLTTKNNNYENKNSNQKPRKQKKSDIYI